jgi:formylglycine-generating enzyme required for sulfatase activity
MQELELAPGFVLDGRYRIEDRIGQGGFGRVYRAVDVRFAAPVAVKELIYQGSEPGEWESRFRREAGLLFTLKHRALPKVTDFLVSAGRTFLVMEFIEGRSLKDLIDERDRRPFPVRQILEWFHCLCDILEYLHGRSPPVIHRDIKPANLIWNEGSGTLLLVDFGITRIGSTSRTEAYGTPGYAPPEQACGIALPAVDIYAMGATLHYIITGRNPAEHPFDFEPVRSLRPDAPYALAEAVDRMVALRARDRFSSIAETKAFYEASEKTRGHAKPLSYADPVRPEAAPVQGRETSAGSFPMVARHSRGESLPAEGRKSPNEPLPALARESRAESLPVGVRLRAKPEIPQRPITPLSPVSLPPGLSFLFLNAFGFEEYLLEKDGSILIWIPPGSFLFGVSPGDGEKESGELPVQRLELMGFWIGKEPVTNGRIALFYSRTGARIPIDWHDYWRKTGKEWPAVYLSWHDAVAYCTWAGALLPTEEEWERAARGEDERRYPWGDFFDTARLNCWDSPGNLNRASLFDGKGPSPVGACPAGASEYGCFDMCGNTWEWCRGSSATPIRPLRGGAWNEIPRHCRITKRRGADGSLRANNVGFRIVIEEIIRTSS